MLIIEEENLSPL